MTDYFERVGMHQQLSADTVDTVKLLDPYVRRAFATFDVTGGASEDLWTSDVGHQLVVGDEVQFICAGTGAEGYAAGTSYYVVATPSATTFQLSETKGGSVLAGTGSDSSGAWCIRRVSDKWGGFTDLTHLVIGNVSGSETLYYTLDGSDPRDRQAGVAAGDFAIIPNVSNRGARVKLWAPNSGTNTYLVAQVDPEVYAAPPWQFIQGTRNQIIPTGEFAPVHFDQVNDATSASVASHHDGFYTGRGFFDVMTTVAAGSNSQALSNLTSDTLNVASTAGFPTPSATSYEYAVVFDVSDSFKCQVVRYTGKTATTLTGIGTVSGAPTGSITVATGDAVAPAHVNITGRPRVSFGADTHYLTQSIGQVIWENEATTPTTLDTIRRMRFEVNTTIGGSAVLVPYWRADLPGFDAPTPGLIHQIVAQPGATPSSSEWSILTVYQNSGAALEIVGAASGGVDASMSTQAMFADIRKA